MKYRFKLQSATGAGFPPFVSESVDTLEEAEAGLDASYGLLMHLDHTLADTGYRDVFGFIESRCHSGPWGVTEV